MGILAGSEQDNRWGKNIKEKIVKKSVIVHTDNPKVVKENAVLTQKNATLLDENADLGSANKKAQDELAKVKAENSALIKKLKKIDDVTEEGKKNRTPRRKVSNTR